MQKLSKSHSREISIQSPQSKFTFQPYSTRHVKGKSHNVSEISSTKNLTNKPSLLSKYQVKLTTQQKSHKHIQEIPSLPISKFLQTNTSNRSTRIKPTMITETGSFNNSINISGSTNHLLNYTAQRPISIKQTATKKID